MDKAMLLNAVPARYNQPLPGASNLAKFTKNIFPLKAGIGR
jgi:hypothetical protein